MAAVPRIEDASPDSMAPEPSAQAETSMGPEPTGRPGGKPNVLRDRWQERAGVLLAGSYRRKFIKQIINFEDFEKFCVILSCGHAQHR